MDYEADKLYTDYVYEIAQAYPNYSGVNIRLLW